ncbi:uncharacterized protein ColSpa_00031 [Colletotrichum spaethianum]|uniref:Uncharacterized protein n=1 Tax=Colletotrichum spaethianum TaxID=700344 RepID=A0AA37L5J9_9PEZI|nr:uncharacterized protein ColSpa_00031 [Colletotrichum spaethianum]GKT39850.1 hypothetical protein ColSpa_00031 [Colletotrichum spaethianum]
MAAQMLAVTMSKVTSADMMFVDSGVVVVGLLSGGNEGRYAGVDMVVLYVVDALPPSSNVALFFESVACGIGSK